MEKWETAFLLRLCNVAVRKGRQEWEGLRRFPFLYLYFTTT